MAEWMRKCVTEWTREWVTEWTRECGSAGVRGSAGECGIACGGAEVWECENAGVRSEAGIRARIMRRGCCGADVQARVMMRGS